MNKYELIILGISPAGEEAALKASSLGYKVALIDECSKEKSPSSLSGWMKKPTASWLRYQKNYLFDRKREEIASHLKQGGVDYYRGEAAFEDPPTLLLRGDPCRRIHGNRILIATGSIPSHPPFIP